MLPTGSICEYTGPDCTCVGENGPAYSLTHGEEVTVVGYNASYDMPVVETATRQRLEVDAADLTVIG